MRFSISFLLLPLAAQAANLVLSNDDSWAEMNIRTFYDTLTLAGHDVVLSAPARGKSGTGTYDRPPKPLGKKSCKFNSCPPGSPAIGADPTNPRINYVNSYPVTSMRHGIVTLGPRFFDGGRPDLALSGPNVGTNVGTLMRWQSGTLGAAQEAAKLGIPAIAFSGASGDKMSYRNPTPLHSQIYANLSSTVVTTLLASGDPLLPPGTFLNVNYSPIGGGCDSANDFGFVFSRIHHGGHGKNVFTCGSSTLPRESHVVHQKGCRASVSLATTSKEDTSAAEQAIVHKKLESILSCLVE